MALQTVVRMAIFNHNFMLVLAAFTLIAGGCSDSPKEKAAATVVTPVSNSRPVQPTPPPGATAGEPEPSPPEAEKEPETVAVEYPFPEREDLFLPPAKKPSNIKAQSTSNEDVVLMGFAEVEGALAILKIDGIVTPLRVGEARGDVGVLSIDPPEVHLQRGEHQWAERLTNNL
jgi:hypothetical protein